MAAFRTPRTMSTARIARSLITRPPSGGGYRDPAPLPAPNGEKVAVCATFSPTASPIGAAGFEPATSPTRTVRATRLRHAPKAGILKTGRRARNRPPLPPGLPRLYVLLRTASRLSCPWCRSGRWTTTAGPKRRQPVGRRRAVTSASIRSATSGESRASPPRVQVEVGDRVADVVEELVGDGVRRGLVLVAEEEIDVLPLAVLLAGGGRRVGGHRGLGLAEGEVPELEPRRAGRARTARSADRPSAARSRRSARTEGR